MSFTFDLPYDVIVNVLSYFTTPQHCVLSNVCKLWHKASLDYQLGWCVVATTQVSNFVLGSPVYILKWFPTKKIYLNDEISAAQKRFDESFSPASSSTPPMGMGRGKGTDRATDRAYMIGDLYSPTPEYVMLETMHGESVGPLLFKNTGHNPAELRLLRACENSPKLWRCMAYKREPVLQDNEIEVRKEYMGSLEFELRFSLNVRVFEKMVLNENINIPEVGYICSHVKQVNEALMYTYKESLTHPIPQLLQQIEGLKPEISLWKYQLEAISWMKAIEEQKEKGFPYVDLKPWRKARSRVLFDFTVSHALVHLSKLHTHIHTIHPAGGVLADESTLGKSAEVIGLILANPCQKTNTDTIEYIDGSQLCNVKATLIVCPSHTVYLWVDEIFKFTSLRYVVIKDITKAVDYDAIFNADVVILSYQRLLGYSYVPSKHKIPKIIIRKGVNTDPSKVRPSELIQFYWHRVILDDYREMVNFHPPPTQFQGNYKWIVDSKPPFFTADNIQDAIKFLLSESIDQQKFSEVLLTRLFWKNTKDSIRDKLF